MKPATAKTPETTALEDLGRATLRIVHDLKNQLNGLKLYATYLRKRLEREDSSSEQRETVEKLIAGLNRAARDLTILVRYAQPVELQQQPDTDLRKIVLAAACDPANRGSGSLTEALVCDIPDGSFAGAFDPHVLADALGALTREAFGRAASNNPQSVSLRMERTETIAAPEVVIEWRGLKTRTQAAELRAEGGSVHAAFAARVITAHGGRLEFDRDVIRVSLPLTN